MKGKRLPDGTPPRKPGEYSYMPYDRWEYRPTFFLGEGEWHVISPAGGIGAFGRSTVEHPDGAHSVEIRADGTITVSPSLIFPGTPPTGGWHGFLVAGVFS